MGWLGTSNHATARMLKSVEFDKFDQLYGLLDGRKYIMYKFI